MARRAHLPAILAVVLLGLGCTTAPQDLDAAPSVDAGAEVDGAFDAGAVPFDAAPPLDATPADAAGRADAGGAVDAGTDAATGCPVRPRLGLFVWTDSLAPRRDELLDLADAHEVTEIYLHANLFFSRSLSETVLADWIGAANARCIDVELLFGNARWILPAGQAEARARTDWAVAFAASHPAARPSGIHFDLEPQQLAEWGSMTAMRPTYVSNLVDVLEAMTPVAEAGGLPLSCDIGFFLDGVSVSRGGTTRPGHEWVTDAVSRVVVMDYRDSAESMGFGGMISLAQTEVGYASSAGTPIVLAVETQPVAEEYVTFREEGLAVMLAELALSRAHFASEPSFAGFAIHDETGLAALPP